MVLSFLGYDNYIFDDSGQLLLPFSTIASGAVNPGDRTILLNYGKTIHWEPQHENELAGSPRLMVRTSLI